MEKSLEWTNLWERQGNDSPTSYGVDYAVDAKGQKFYLAYARAGNESDIGLSSEAYKSCDDADAEIESYAYVGMASHARVRDKAIVARARMKVNERSPKDMEAMAWELHGECLRQYRLWDTQQSALKKKQIDDEEACRLFMKNIRGLEVAVERGYDLSILRVLGKADIQPPR